MSAFDFEFLMADLRRRIHLLETTQPMGYSSVSQGRSRFVGNESILVQGSGKVEGWWIVTGTQRVTGLLEGTGTLDWEGPWYLRGNGSIPGNVNIIGSLDVSGAARILSTLQILGATTLGSTLNVVGGRIQAGNMFLDGSSGGTLGSSGTLNLAGANINLASAGLTTATFFKATSIEAVTLDVAGAKSFKIPHPTKMDHFLRHGATESPVSGVEYWGEETLPASGSVTVELPEYFEALTNPDGRAVLVTARGFVADWGDIDDGKFTVTGNPGGRFSWLVKAARADVHGGHFEKEEQVFRPVREAA